MLSTIENLPQDQRFKESVLLPYQQRWLMDSAPIRVWVKSRRIGASWAAALEAVLDGAATKGRNTIYLSYNREMTIGFIKDCEFWARSLNIAASEVIQAMFKNEDKDILTHEIRFASGKTIKALSGKPNNIRSRQASVILDEASFCEDLPELLKAAIALLMWQGKVSIISTQNGEDNPFNQLVKRIKSGELAYSLHTTTLDDALADGLYQRICLVQGRVWTPIAQEEWRSQLYRDYGIAAEEELDCKPFSAQAGKVFSREWFEVVNTVPPGGEEVRAWDFAGTEKHLRNDPDYTAGVKIRRVNGTFYVVDVIAVQQSAATINQLIASTAAQDGPQCKVRWEIEPGASGKINSATLAKMLAGYDAGGVRPSGDKLTRAKPFAAQAANGNVKLLRAAWNDPYLGELHAVPEGAHDDRMDASAGAFNELVKTPTKQGGGAMSYATW